MLFSIMIIRTGQCTWAIRIQIALIINVTPQEIRNFEIIAGLW